ncbi:MAG TPA: SDR family oxidoreductase [Gammaproteobacteria bacterium]|nr:SDR family oxidoreductase [Gammaproteobacteria bacterium]
MKTLQDRVAVVTGAGSGIGRSVALELARRGAHLALADLDEAGMRETASQVEALGRKVTTHVIDVSDRGRMERFPDEVVEAHGRVHVVVNNAGVTVVHTVEKMDLDDFEWIMGINFWGMVYGSKFFLPYLLREDEGHIVNLSSVFGIIGVPNQSSYCSSKFAIRGFTESLRGELRDTAVRVTSVHPGGVDTNIVRSSRFRDSMTAQSKEELAETFRKATMTTPEKAGRLIADAIAAGRPRLLVGPDAKLLDKIQRLMPVRYRGLVDWLMRRGQE